MQIKCKTGFFFLFFLYNRRPKSRAVPVELQLIALHENFHTSDLRDETESHVTLLKEESTKCQTFTLSLFKSKMCCYLDKETVM